MQTPTPGNLIILEDEAIVAEKVTPSLLIEMTQPEGMGVYARMNRCLKGAIWCRRL